METWVVFFLLSILCLLIGLLLPKRTSREKNEIVYAGGVPKLGQSGSTMSSLSFPISHWDEASITSQLKQLRDSKPDLIPHFVESVKERFILRQDDRTAQARLRFMQTQIEQLRLAKEFKQLAQDLELLAYEREKRIKTLQLETDELDSKRKSRGPLDELAATRERKKIELEIAQLDQQIDGLKTAQRSGPRPSPEQERANRHAQIDARLAKLKEEKQKALRIEDEQERILKVNAIDDEIQRLAKEWGETL